MGMYPQTVVPLGDLHNMLTNNYANQSNGVTATGASYTANQDGTAWNATTSQELNYEYSYNGAKYVKVTPYANWNNATYTYNNNGGAIGQNGVARWFKVEPIKWIVLNFDKYKDKINEAIGYRTEIDTLYVPQGATLELYAADVLISGIAFNNVTYSELWANSDVTTYLNGDFYNQAFSSNDKEQIQVSTNYNNTDSSNYNNSSYNLNSNHLVGTGYNRTDQKIYLLSRYELENAVSPYVSTNPIFTNDGNRKVSGTDYARAHNLYLLSGSARYWTRTAFTSDFVYYVTDSGGFSTVTAFNATHGTRPALTMVCFAL